MQLDKLAILLALHPDVSDLLEFEGLITFCDIVYWLKDEISSIQRANVRTAPLILPSHICNFIADALSVSYEDTSRIWGVLRELAWAGTDLETDTIHKARRAQAILPLFLKYGPAHGVSFYTLRPPTRVCCDPGCSAKPVGRPAACSDGVEYAPRQLGEPLSHDIVVFTRDLGPLPATALSLYCRVPDFVQITQHYYIAREVCEMFATLMNVSWTSATNCAKFYNLSMAKAEIDALLPAEWKLTRALTTEHVWDAFFTYSLLLDHHERGTILQLAHNTTSHTERLRPALQARNALMVGPGQEQWSHACDLCCWVEQDKDGHMSSNPSVSSNVPETTLENDQEPPPAEAVCDAKSADGNRRLHALFGRRRTHNEELCVTSCGVIIGRATFFGSEAVNGVIAFWRRLFPTRASLPQVQWHDNNCRVWATLNAGPAETREYFADIALPVDVFHFKCKHKETDVVCGTHCNPYIWPELRTVEGRWRFNSSAAEQCNVWFGKYQAIVREMDVDRYNFFLDEMIKRRNRLIIAELERKGRHPYLIPRSELFNA
ncbi:hypothetical protein TRAPUB_5269 [Trametes pubescens]|uniref:CxC5 like cysteine cluster associated with KDZ domain-containing protein n=1 Tax=Trametes pubescens TaxID=154538 RepID=A0A1M2V939_TRAPU|nr:hypothetical protein TRAPUB_5269 [Trametes pubescens]